MKAYAVHVLEDGVPVHTVVYGYSIFSVLEKLRVCFLEGESSILVNGKSGRAAAKRMKSVLKKVERMDAPEALSLFNSIIQGAILEEQPDARTPICYGWTAADFIP